MKISVKRTICIFFIGSLLLETTACHQKTKNNFTSTAASTPKQEASSTPKASAAYENASPSLYEVDWEGYEHLLPAREYRALKEYFPIFLSEAEVTWSWKDYSEDKNEWLPQKSTQPLKEFYSSFYQEHCDDEAGSFLLRSISLCDLTGDGTQELVLNLANTAQSSLILHKEGENYYGIEMPKFWFYRLQSNGVYMAGRKYYLSYHRILFQKGEFEEKRLGYRKDALKKENDTSYYIQEEKTDEDTFRHWLDSIMPGNAEEYLPPVKKTQENPLSISRQLQVIADNAKKWYTSKEYYYAVTDLDQNGRLELIASTGAQGSGRFTYSTFYQLTPEGDALQKCKTDVKEGDSENDIVDNLSTAYYNKKTGEYHYITGDFATAGLATGYYKDVSSMTLKGNRIKNRILGYYRKEITKKKTTVTNRILTKSGKEKNSNEAFDREAIAENAFSKCTKLSVKIAWFQFDKSLKKTTAQQLSADLSQSYQTFFAGHHISP